MTGNSVSRVMAAAATILLLALIFGCKKNELPQAAPPEVQVAAVEQRDVPVYREWVGTLEGQVNATISAQVSGYLLTRNYGW